MSGTDSEIIAAGKAKVLLASDNYYLRKASLNDRSFIVLGRIIYHNHL